MKELMLTGVTAETPQNIQLNAGVLLKNFDVETATINEEDIIGATRGGGSLSIAPTVRQVEADGLPQNFKGMVRVDDWVVTFNTTLIEFKKDTLKLALGAGVKEVQKTKMTELTVTHEIGDTDYSDIWWVGQNGKGDYIAIKIENGMNLTGLVITISDKGEGTYPITITAHYTLQNLKEKTVPCKVYVPNEEE